MATTFPTSIQDLDATRGSNNDKLSTPNHVTHHTTEDDTIEALQAKVGVDGSAVTTSHDYKLSTITGSNKAVSNVNIKACKNATNNSKTSINKTNATETGAIAKVSKININDIKLSTIM